MPWFEGDKHSPAVYRLPSLMYFDTALGAEHCMRYARAQRRDWTRHREEMLAAQKDCGKDYATARYFREEAAYALKVFRGYDLAVRWVETSDKSGVSEQIAPFVDRAFAAMDYCEEA